MSVELPGFRWTLSAPESQVLLTSAETEDPWVLKFALLELMVVGGHRLEYVSKPRLRFFFSRDAGDQSQRERGEGFGL